MGRKKKTTDEPKLGEDEQAPPDIAQISAKDINLIDLFERLKEFDNKVLLERLKILERNVALLHKEQQSNRVVLKEIHQIVSYLSVSQEEVLNGLGINLDYPEDTDESIIKEAEQIAHQNIKDGKKWN
jgi:hypothetical protein